MFLGLDSFVTQKLRSKLFTFFESLMRPTTKIFGQACPCQLSHDLDIWIKKNWNVVHLESKEHSLAVEFYIYIKRVFWSNVNLNWDLLLRKTYEFQMLTVSYILETESCFGSYSYFYTEVTVYSCRLKVPCKSETLTMVSGFGVVVFKKHS